LQENSSIANLKPIESMSTKSNTDENKSKAEEYFNKALDKTDIAQKIGFYNKAIVLDPGYSRAHKNKGDCYVNLKKYQEAIECFDKAIDLDPSYLEAHKNKGDCYVNLKKYEEAIECFDKAVDLDLDDLDSYYNREIAINELKQNKNLVDEYRNKIIKQNLNDLDGYKKNANILLFYLDEYEKAID